MKRHAAVAQEVVCDACCGRHSNFLARCLVTGAEAVGSYAREVDQEVMRYEGDPLWDPLDSALQRLRRDGACVAEHEVAS